ncbi:MAG: ThiF family adenylyltransferase [Thermoflavifilum sp.]|nr:ThiF family adenylyltransferase [Thermoflavifilum sp.]MCL6513852.1 ThiF family adenylyltransferase [Alicyclobacillus sp.]
MPPDLARYSRQVLFRPLGPDGQRALRQARMAVVGMGALGTAIATQLVRAGVGFVRLIDRDIVEASNLQRQVLYDEADAAAFRPKAVAAAEKLRAANTEVELEPVVADLTAANAETYLADVDVILDGSDNFQVRYLINDVAVKHGIPWAYGGAVASYGTTGFIRPGETPCLVCLFGDDPGGGHDTCDTVGVIAPIVQIIAALQVAEVLKWCAGRREALRPGLMAVDVWANEFRTVRYPPRAPECRCCGQRQFTALEAGSGALTVSLCGRRTVQVRPHQPLAIPLERLGARLSRAGRTVVQPYALRFEPGDGTAITLFPDGRALIHGVDDEAAARGLYARYIGM